MSPITYRPRDCAYSQVIVYASTPAGPSASYMAICGLTAGTMSAIASMIARLYSK